MPYEGRWARSVLLAAGILLGMGSASTAQTPTNPSKTWFYCWGYHVDDGRQYNCVSSVARQSITERFLPAQGTACTARVRGYSLGRTGLQVDCGGGGGDPRPPGSDYTIQDVQKYDAIADVSHWISYNIRAHRNLESFYLTIRFHYPNRTFSDCTDWIYSMDANEVREEFVIPDFCGTDDTWSAVEFISPSDRSCVGCRRYSAAEIPWRESLSVRGTTDPRELDRLIGEMEAGFLSRATGH